jgi:hypothetical protein
VKKKEYNYTEQASKTLWQLSNFKWTVGIIPVVSFVVTLFILFSNNFNFDTTYESWNNLIIIFRVPLGILAIIILVVAAIASNHRSLQSKVLIKLQDGQNKFSNYYKHKEEFDKYLANTIQLQGKTIYNVHNLIFPDVNRGNYKNCPRIVEEKTRHIIQLLDTYSAETSDKNIELIYSINILLENLEQSIGVINDKSGKTYNQNGIKMIIKGGGHMKGHFYSIQSRIGILKTILEFDSLSELPKTIESFLELDFSTMPENITVNTMIDNNGVDMKGILFGTSN